MTTPAPHGAPPVEHHWEAARGDAKRLASAETKRLLLEPRFLVMMGVLLVLSGVVIPAEFLLDDFTVVFVVIFAVDIFVLTIVAFAIWLLRWQYARLARAGAKWAAEYGPSSMVVHRTALPVEVDYGKLSGLTRGFDDTVVLTSTGSSTKLVLPAELCPPAVFDFLTDVITRSRPR